MALYSVTAVFRHEFSNPDQIPQYEERTTVVDAHSLAEAQERLETELAQYVEPSQGLELVDQGDVLELLDTLFEGVAEVAPIMRVSHLSPTEFTDLYFSDLRPGSCADVGWRHVWYNHDNENSGCFNCMHIEKGRLWESPEREVGA
jgi:hypothetical protein